MRYYTAPMASGMQMARRLCRLSRHRPHARVATLASLSETQLRRAVILPHANSFVRIASLENHRSFSSLHDSRSYPDSGPGAELGDILRQMDEDFRLEDEREAATWQAKMAASIHGGDDPDEEARLAAGSEEETRRLEMLDELYEVEREDERDLDALRYKRGDTGVYDVDDLVRVLKSSNARDVCVIATPSSLSHTPSASTTPSTSPAPAASPNPATSPTPSSSPTPSTNSTPSTSPASSTSHSPSTSPTRATSPTPSSSPTPSTSPAPSTRSTFPANSPSSRSHDGSWMVVVTAVSVRHIRAIARDVVRGYKQRRRHDDPHMPQSKRHSEDAAGWVTLDVGPRLTLHVMMRDVREHYDLEALWVLGGDVEGVSETAKDNVATRRTVNDLNIAPHYKDALSDELKKALGVS